MRGTGTQENDGREQQTGNFFHMHFFNMKIPFAHPPGGKMKAKRDLK
jgi:hypothetical protein